MNKTIEALYQSIALKVFQAKPDGEWISATYNLKKITCMSIATCNYLMKDGSTHTAITSVDVDDEFAKLREEMAKLNPEKGAWYTALFTLTPDCDFKFDFDYDHLPTFRIVPSPGKWADEFKHHPRPELQAQIQDWLDNKVEHNVVRQRLVDLQSHGS